MRSLPNIVKKGAQGTSIQQYHFSDDFSYERNNGADGDSSGYSESLDIFENAITQAEEITNKAREEAEQIKKEAYEEGQREGYEAGYHEGHQKGYEDYQIRMNLEIAHYQEEMKEAIAEVTVRKNLIMEEYIDDLKKITMTIAEKVIQTSLKSSGEVIERMILAAAEKLKKTQWAKIYVTKNEHSITMQGDEKFIQELSRLSDHVKIIAMESEEEGTCVIELPEAIVDASVSTQLGNIKDILNNARL